MKRVEQSNYSVFGRFASNVLAFAFTKLGVFNVSSEEGRKLVSEKYPEGTEVIRKDQTMSGVSSGHITLPVSGHPFAGQAFLDVRDIRFLKRASIALSLKAQMARIGLWLFEDIEPMSKKGKK